MVDKLGDQRTEESGRWTSHVLEYDSSELKTLMPLPPVAGPIQGEDRRYKVPESVSNYLARRYGFGTEVRIKSSHGKGDGSGYSYSVYGDDREIAYMAAERVMIFLPPDYTGPLKNKLAQVEESNRNLTDTSKPEEPEETLWVIHENGDARGRFIRQLQTLRVPA